MEEKDFRTMVFDALIESAPGSMVCINVKPEDEKAFGKWMRMAKNAGYKLMHKRTEGQTFCITKVREGSAFELKKSYNLGQKKWLDSKKEIK